MSTTPVSVFGGIYHVVAAFESNLIPPGEGWFFWYLVISIVLSYIEWIRLLRIFELYPRGFSVPPLAAQLPNNRSFTEIFAGRGVDVHIVCTYRLTVSAVVNDFVNYLVHKSVFVALHPKVL